MQTTCARQKKKNKKKKSFQHKNQRNKFHEESANILLYINGKWHTTAADLNVVAHSFLVITENFLC
jgi:hypothetical protein